MASTAGASEGRKSRSGSEKRKRCDQIAWRLHEGRRQVLEQEAARLGLRSAQELLDKQFESLFAQAGL